MLNLSFGIKFSDLYNLDGLKKVDEQFLRYLKSENEQIYQNLQDVRKNFINEDSALMIAISQYLDEFIAKMFQIEKEVESLQNNQKKLDVLYKCKTDFVRRFVLTKFSNIKVGNSIELDILKYLPENKFDELEYARLVMLWMSDRSRYVKELQCAAMYAIYRIHTLTPYYEGVLFNIPEKLDYDNLLDISNTNDGIINSIRSNRFRYRDNFDLTDHGASNAQALMHANYCIFCHRNQKDSCSIGLKTKEGEFKKSPHNVPLEGCPLGEKISEMNMVKSAGYDIAALGIITRDNPLCAGTGHRICNDCMKSCIYQKQEPVNIPMVESNILDNVLELKYGFEIYSLLTRWNPLNFIKPIINDFTGHNVLIVGAGPAGYTMAHYLLNEGHGVVLIDGLKIEPISSDLSGIMQNGERVDFRPICNIKEELYESLNDRVIYGFGGVSEYGITVRWNKNYLKVLRLLIERRERFLMFGGTRFGSNITYYDAFYMLNFDHVVFAMGAGKQNMINIRNSMIRGVRMASDFLMMLHMSKPYDLLSISNVQVRLPVVVIGAGLTAIDTATESIAYYIMQVEKFLHQYEILSKKLGIECLESSWSEEEKEIAYEFMEHARILRSKKEEIKLHDKKSLLLDCIRKWGGVKILYYKKFIDSASYRLNHEEVQKALDEGVEFIENMNSLEFKKDKYKHVKCILAENVVSKEKVEISARTVMIAIGTNPNNIVQEEYNNIFKLDGGFLQLMDKNGNVRKPSKSSKSGEELFLTHICEDKRAVSIVGDLHPSYNGNVVKAMASSKNAAPFITKMLEKIENNVDYNKFRKNILDHLVVQVEEVKILTSSIVEVIIRSKLASKHFQPGQFYRLQNYLTQFDKLSNFGISYKNEVDKSKKSNILMEALALTGSSIDKENGIVSLIILEMGGSSNLCRSLKKGDNVVLMGPTGQPSEIPKNKNMLLIGGGLGNAVLFSIGHALRENGCKVLYVAGYNSLKDVYKPDMIENSSDFTIWSCDNGLIDVHRDNDVAFHGNIVDALRSYCTEKILHNVFKLQEIDQIMIIGSVGMMTAVKNLFKDEFSNQLKPSHKIIASVNSPMQCMMKGICAQCIQRHEIEPGKEEFVYSCISQDQNAYLVDFDHLNERLKQSILQEKISKDWMKYYIEN